MNLMASLSSENQAYDSSVAYRFYYGVISDVGSWVHLGRQLESILRPISYDVLIQAPVDSSFGGEKDNIVLTSVPVVVQQDELIAKLLEFFYLVMIELISFVLGGKVLKAGFQALNRYRDLINNLLDILDLLLAWTRQTVAFSDVIIALKSLIETLEILGLSKIIRAYAIYPPSTPVLLYSPDGDIRNVYILGALQTNREGKLGSEQVL